MFYIGDRSPLPLLMLRSGSSGLKNRFLSLEVFGAPLEGDLILLS